MTLCDPDRRQAPSHDHGVDSSAPARGQAFDFQQGDFSVTVLSDGSISIPGDIFTMDAPADRVADLLTCLGAAEGLVSVATNIPLIRTGNDLILVDIGGGHRYQPTDGKLYENLAAAGFDAAAVTKVVFTHAHPDHIWATLTESGQLRFPNATYFIGAAEWDFWMDPDYLTTMPSVLHEFAQGTRRDLGAVKDRVVMLKHGDDVVTGFRALDTPGHTPGHLSFELAGREGLIIAADVATNQIVSFEHPNWRQGFDTIPEAAIASRKSLLDRAAADQTKLLGYHWNYPGIGYVERRGSGFRFVDDCLI